ncbi:MAG TPA: hypothetical protein PLR30_03810 [Saprospiraceae bacterium]|nr:hypothetical protein [Saprospiraceae bacterium]
MPESNEREPYYGDLQKTQILTELFAVAQENRDDAWKHHVIQHLAEASFRSGDPQLLTGPGGFPYFQLLLPEPGTAFECYVLSHMVDDFLFERGWGVVINLKGNQPDWLLTYGDVVNYKLKKEFYSAPQISELPPTGVIQQDEQVLVGQPSDSLLPPQVRNAMRQYLEFHGHHGVKIALLTRMTSQGPVQQLIFDLAPEQFADEPTYQAFLQSLGWFMPQHYIFGSMDAEVMKGHLQAL